MSGDEITFGRFRLDLRRRALLRDGKPVRLSGRMLDILCAFASAGGDVVSKDELMTRVWAGRAVEEGNIHVHVSMLRKALDDHGEGHGYIVTIPGRGYRLSGLHGSPSAASHEAPTLKDLSPRDNSPIARDRDAPPAPQGWPWMLESRQLTVVSCELDGLARLAVRLDPEDLRALIVLFHRCCLEAVGRFGGVVSHFTGDGMLACFGYPQAQEHDAEQAVRASLEILGAVGRLHTPAVLELRFGIATGPVVVGDLIGGGRPQDSGVVGETRNLASGLRRIAKPNTVVIAPSTRRLVGAFFECRELAGQVIEGFEGEISAWEVVRASSVDSRFEALRGSSLTPLVGREEDLDLLLRHWQHAKAGEIRMALIAGEPGIGKSRLAVALRDCIRAEPHACLRYYCSPHHRDSALYPIVRQLERAAAFQRGDTAEAKLAKLTSLFASSSLANEDLSLLSELLSLPAPAGVEPVNLTPRLKREKTLETLIRQLEAAAGRHPLLIIFEDAHWSDPTSIEFLDLVIKRLARRPVLLLVTFRPEFAPSWAGQAHTAALTLSRLDRRGSATLIRHVVGNDVLTDDTIDEITERTDGVPLFLEELSKAVLETKSGGGTPTGEVMPRSAIMVPTTLQASLMARLDRLDPAAKEAAQIGAAIGREFSYEVAAAIAEQTGTEIDKGLQQLMDSGLVFGRGAAPDAVLLFKHGLIRDAAYSTLPFNRRRQLHARIAAALEERFAEIAEQQPAVVAHHYAEAGLISRAVDYWGKAGRKSIAQSAMLEAAAQLRRGLDLLSTLPGDAGRWRREFELQSALGAAVLASQGHGAPEVGEVFARARELGERLGDAEALVPVLSGQFSFYLQRSEYASGRQIAEELLRLADRRSDRASAVVGHRAMGVCLHQLGAFTSAATHFEQVLELYLPERHQSLAAVAGFDPRAAALRYLAFGQFIRGYPSQALSRMSEVMHWSRKLGHPYIMVHALNWMASFHLLRGVPAAALAPLEELSALAEQKFPLWFALGQINRGLLLANSDRPEDGLAVGRKGFDAMMAIESTWNQTYYRGMLAQICESADRPEEARNELDTALSIAETTGEQWFEAELHRLMGEWLIRHRPSARSDAEARFRRAIAVAQRQDAKMWELRAAASLSRLCRGEGRDTEARAVLAPVHGWFTEGLDLPDLLAASELLNGRA